MLPERIHAIPTGPFSGQSVVDHRAIQFIGDRIIVRQKQGLSDLRPAKRGLLTLDRVPTSSAGQKTQTVLFGHPHFPAPDPPDSACNLHAPDRHRREDPRQRPLFAAPDACARYR